MILLNREISILGKYNSLTDFTRMWIDYRLMNMRNHLRARWNRHLPSEQQPRQLVQTDVRHTQNQCFRDCTLGPETCMSSSRKHLASWRLPKPLTQWKAGDCFASLSDRWLLLWCYAADCQVDIKIKYRSKAAYCDYSIVCVFNSFSALSAFSRISIYSHSLALCPKPWLTFASYVWPAYPSASAGNSVHSTKQ